MPTTVTRAAGLALTKALSKELAPHNILVNTVCIGKIKSGQHERRYQREGIEAVRDFRDVCRRADVYVCDNSSTLFAFAATGRPVVVLNPPWYDRRVDHGLRFWDAADVGVQCNDPRELGPAINEALHDTPGQKRRREAALELVYAYRTGAAQRAADVLQEWAA